MTYSVLHRSALREAGRAPVLARCSEGLSLHQAHVECEARNLLAQARGEAGFYSVDPVATPPEVDSDELRDFLVTVLAVAPSEARLLVGYNL